MNRTVAMLAAAGACALSLSACNGGASSSNGVSALPQAHGILGRAKPYDNGPQDLHAGGADIPAYAYNVGNQPVGNYNDAQSPPGAGSLFYSAPTSGTIYYCQNNSGDGRKVFEGGPGADPVPATGPCAALGQTATGFGGRQDPLDFAGTATALASTEYATYKEYREPSTGTTWGEPFEFPQIGNEIVFGYTAKNFSIPQIKLSTWTYCAISNGTISDWNDPAITADNGASVTGGNAEPVTFFFRSDSASSTTEFTNHLNVACNTTWKAPYNKAPYESSGHSAAWTFGANSTWPGPGSSGDPNPNYIGAVGDPGILNGIQANKFATGYVVGGYVKPATPPVAQAILQNGQAGKNPIWVDPTDKKAVAGALKKVTAANIDYGEGSDGVPLGTTRPECVLYIDPKYFVSPPKRTYPIVGISYLLFYGKNNDSHTQDKIALIEYLESPKSTKVIKRLEYTPLASSVQKAVVTALNGGSSHGPCVQ
ncbi:MAG TPA: substrate-binding domain-containing protein [Candidatus Tumulicola sp.]